jgi:hypothetical protein
MSLIKCRKWRESWGSCSHLRICSNSRWRVGCSVRGAGVSSIPGGRLSSLWCLLLSRQGLKRGLLSSLKTAYSNILVMRWFLDLNAALARRKPSV